MEHASSSQSLCFSHASSSPTNYISCLMKHHDFSPSCLIRFIGLDIKLTWNTTSRSSKNSERCRKIFEWWREPEIYFSNFGRHHDEIIARKWWLWWCATVNESLRTCGYATQSLLLCYCFVKWTWRMNFRWNTNERQLWISTQRPVDALWCSWCPRCRCANYPDHQCRNGKERLHEGRSSRKESLCLWQPEACPEIPLRSRS